MAHSLVIEAKKIKKSFVVGPNTIEVIRGVSFDIHPGDYCIFFGPSGCGKSTLLNLCSGLENPTEGKFYCTGVGVCSGVAVGPTRQISGRATYFERKSVSCKTTSARETL